MGDDGRFSRRSFLERTAAAGAGIAASVALGSAAFGQVGAAAAAAEGLAPAAAKRARIALIKSDHALVNDQVDRAKCLEMIDAAVSHVYGVADASQAWRKVAGPTDVVAIKVNLISNVLYTNPLLTDAVCQRLVEAGVPPQSIIVFDRTTGELQGRGYPNNRGGVAAYPGGLQFRYPVQVYGTDGDYSAKFSHRSYQDRISKIVTERATVMVNLPVLKDHGAAQVTLSLKNHYGTIDNPGPYHGNYCDPHIADINDIPAIKGKQRLVICDALRGCFRNGPGPSAGDLFMPLSIIAGSDAVACDTIGTMLVDAARANRGLPRVGGDTLPRHINTAASYGLGTNQMASMDVLRKSV
jgi:uncharacterized protein (DUF362 family)